MIWIQNALIKKSCFLLYNRGNSCYIIKRLIKPKMNVYLWLFKPNLQTLRNRFICVSEGIETSKHGEGKQKLFLTLYTD